MNTYTKDQILDAVREELIEANHTLGISDGLTDKDYTFIGVVAASIQRLDSKAELLLKEETAKDLPSNECPHCGISPLMCKCCGERL